jgi:hypothetical protein
MGRRLKLKANFLPINVNLDTNIFHYDMQVRPSACWLWLAGWLASFCRFIAGLC